MAELSASTERSSSGGTGGSSRSGEAGDNSFQSSVDSGSGATAAVAAASASSVANELSDTSADDWLPPRKTGTSTAADPAGMAVQLPNGAGTWSATEEQQPQKPQFTSTGKIYATPASNGMPIKYYYKLQVGRSRCQILVWRSRSTSDACPHPL